jgi:hypothetical protein
MHVEDTSAGFNGGDISASTISFDKTTQDGVFQFVTKNGSNDAKIYRILMNSTSDDARIFAYRINDIGGVDREVSVNVASTFNNQDFAALSMSYANQTAPYNTDVVDAQACIETSSGNIDTDNTNTCASNSKTALNSSGADGIETFVQTLNGGTIRADAISDDLADNLPSFTAGTILSAGIQLY